VQRRAPNSGSATQCLAPRPPSRRDALALVGAGIAGCLAGPAALAQPASPAGGEPAAPGDDVRNAIARRAGELDQFHSLVVAQGGEIAFAEAFRGPPVDRPVNIKSVSKTVVAALVGAGLHRGALEGVEQRFSDLAGDLVPEDTDPRVKELTLSDLLTMQAGLERTSGPNYGRWIESANWIRFALSRPFVAEPGERMLYSTGSYHLLGAALSRTTGQSLLDLARAWLGEPLDIEIPPWTRDPQGFYLGGNNMAMSPLALIRFGELHRLGGVWEGDRLLAEGWVDAAWTPRTRSPYSGDRYGYGWFLSSAVGYDVAYARGYGGQMLYVVPALELTVAVTSDPTRPARSDGYVGDLNDLLARAIIPAAERIAGRPDNH
jgi:CubicO group peptidase (beta-lactamase class C family)